VSAAHVLTVSAGHLAAAEDTAGLAVTRALLAAGMPVGSRQVVDEDEAAVEAALRPALESPGPAVLLTRPGGSGGEIVRRAIARITGVRLVLSDRLLGLLEEDFTRRGRAMPRRAERRALLPQGAELRPAVDGEPGWSLETARGTALVLPLDSPHLGDLVQGWLRTGARERPGGGGVSVQRVLRTAGIDLSEVEDRLAVWLGREGEVAVSCAGGDAEVRVRLVSRAATRALAEAALGRTEAEVAAALGIDCYGRDEDSLEGAVGRLLGARGLTLSVAESCTGGLVSHRLTNVPGSSRYFERGVVVYSNQAKQELLGVPEPLLRAHGAVSAPVAEAMVAGICRVGGSACGLAVTGIAGPDGGTPDKPVGTVFVAAASPGGVRVARFLFQGRRDAIKWQSSQAALDMLRRALAA
jgi:nicotinamide-nucleotide amidase